MRDAMPSFHSSFLPSHLRTILRFREIRGAGERGKNEARMMGPKSENGFPDRSLTTTRRPRNALGLGQAFRFSTITPAVVKCHGKRSPQCLPFTAARERKKEGGQYHSELGRESERASSEGKRWMTPSEMVIFQLRETFPFSTWWSVCVINGHRLAGRRRRRRREKEMMRSVRPKNSFPVFWSAIGFPRINDDS